ncbi:hypothetical protein MES5069_660015 [Mesorhizobium escarrei]|uniref:GNAT family N-acetyltransferase n=1 Tax=Mesorhizobium escarrei TaxID=666018 RepID=A0ABM9EFZ6_9HYPH|nr:hypothetical protein MES5069_660015 [Mesorhizobium escarrei]
MRLHTEPDTDWKNIFQLWRANGEAVPFKVAKSTWSADAGHFLIVEGVEVKRWPYGAAWGAILLERCARAQRREGQSTRTFT